MFFFYGGDFFKKISSNILFLVKEDTGGPYKNDEKKLFLFC